MHLASSHAGGGQDLGRLASELVRDRDFVEGQCLMQFADLRLSEPLLRAVTQEGYTVATPIQAKAIPQVLEGRDVLGVAQTGTGKTAAFALPILQRLSANQNN